MRDQNFISFLLILAITWVGVSITFFTDNHEFCESEKLEIFEGGADSENEIKTEYFFSEFVFTNDYLISIKNRNPQHFNDLDFLIKECFIGVNSPPPECLYNLI